MTNDAFLWYNVGQWQEYGLAVPNYGNDPRSQNASIRYLVEVTGRNLQALMLHQDSRVRTPPTINTITRIHKLCVRARDILAGRAIPPGTANMETAHAVPAPESFILFPTPYFKVRNGWMKEYCSLILTALTDAVQMQENGQLIEISTRFAGQFGQYLKRVYVLMATELLQIPRGEADADGFTLTDAQLKAYDPAKWFTSTELIDTVPDLVSWPTEDDLVPITDGIAALDLPKLGPWPSAVTASGGSASSSAASGSGSTFLAAPSP